MGNQKIINGIKQIAFSFFFFGITTMNHAENFEIKHIYTPVVKVLGQHSSAVTFPVYYPIAISNDNYVITENLSDTFAIKSEDFGIYKTPLTEDMKKRMNEVNKILRMPYVKKMVLTNDPKRDLWYQLDINNLQIKMNKYIEGFQRTDTISLENFHSQPERKKAERTIQISNYISDLAKVGYSGNKKKLADFYGITNIIPKKEGLEVTVTLRNIGPFDVEVNSPKEWGGIPKVGEEVNTDKTWYEIIFGGLYKDISWTTRFGLENKYLIKNELQSDKALYGYFIVKSNSERKLCFLVPYQDIEFRSNTGEIDGNRTKEGYVLLDYHTGVLDSSWSMHVNFGDVFSQRTWKEEKTATVKGWVNLE